MNSYLLQEKAQELADKCEHALQFDWKNLIFNS